VRAPSPTSLGYMPMQVRVTWWAWSSQPPVGESVQLAGRFFVTHPQVQLREQAEGIGTHSWDVPPPSMPGPRATHTEPPVQVWAPQGIVLQSRHAMPDTFHVCVAPSHTTVCAQHGSTLSHDVCPLVHASPTFGDVTHPPASPAASGGTLASPASTPTGVETPPQATRTRAQIPERAMRSHLPRTAFARSSAAPDAC